MKAKIGELFLVLGTGLFIAGAIGFMAGYLSQDQTVMFLVAPLASASDWQMVRHDSRNTGCTNETVPDELELLWRGYDPMGWLDRFLGMVMSTDPLVGDTGKKIWTEKYISSIAIANEKVFVGAGAGGEKIYCFGAAKGEKGVPGFEVIFASAGLLIGAYLLRRRVKNGK